MLPPVTVPWTPDSGVGWGGGLSTAKGRQGGGGSRHCPVFITVQHVGSSTPSLGFAFPICQRGRIKLSPASTERFKVKVSQTCPTLCNPMDCSLPGSSAHGILQARILEWVAYPFSRDLPNPGIEPRSPALQVDSLPAELPGKPNLPQGQYEMRV